MAIPQLLAGLDRSRTHAAARFLASRMALARVQAVARGATVGFRFAVQDTGITTVGSYADGNGNGLRSADIASGADPVVMAPAPLHDMFPGVDIALDAPGMTGDAVQFGSSDIASFTAAGTATSGTVYLRGRDGTQLAVRVFGATARTRVLQYDATRRALVDVP